MAERTVRYTYRLRPSLSSERALLREWDLCRAVWNFLVAESRLREGSWRAFAEAGVPTSLAHPSGSMRNCFDFGPGEASKYLTFLRRTLTDPETGKRWLQDGASVPQQQIVRDFTKARTKALHDRKNRIPLSHRRGMPTFKSRRTARPSMNYTSRGFSLKPAEQGRARLHLAGGILIPVVWSRELPSSPRSVRIYRDAVGHWYASFVVTVDLCPIHPAPDAALGIDWGVQQTATTVSQNLLSGELDLSGRYDLRHAAFGERSAGELAQAQRRMALRRPAHGHTPSKGYLRAREEAARAHRRVKNRRSDAAHKWARKLAQSHGRIAMEDFRPKFLSRTTMASKSADAAIAMLKAVLIWQAFKAGADLRPVNPSNTTQDCSNCGARAKHRLGLSERMYTCDHCALSRPRDQNSAAVMIARASFVPASAEGVSPGAALRNRAS